MTSQLLIEVSTSNRPVAERARQLLAQDRPENAPHSTLAQDANYDERSLWLVFLKPGSRRFRGCARIVFPELGEESSCQLAGVHIANKPDNGVQQIVGGVLTWAKIAGVPGLELQIKNSQAREAYQSLGFEAKDESTLSISKEGIRAAAQVHSRNYFVRHLKNVDETLGALREQPALAAV